MKNQCSDKCPVVSVIIPVYNGANFVVDAVESVLLQQEVSFEIIIGDNASTDATLNLLKRYCENPRIRIFGSVKNLGIYGNLNRLIAYANSDLIKILCADDRILPGGLNAQVEYMLSNSELGLSRCRSEGQSLVKSSKGPYRYEHYLPEIIKPSISSLVFFTFGNLPGSLTNVICRKQALINSGSFDQSYPYAGDFEMWVRVAQKYSIGLHKKECVYVQHHDQQGSVTLNKHNELVSQIDRIMEGLFSRIPHDCRDLARYHASVTVVVGHASQTLRRLLEFKWKTIEPYVVSRSYAYHWLICTMLYFLTGGMRWGFHVSTKLLLSKMHKDKIEI
jgi:glycosyltransferase involved in cell wall biosynthesis